jgi:hypothetical protein
MTTPRQPTGLKVDETMYAEIARLKQEEQLSAEKIGARVKLSKGTVQRYLERLETETRLKAELSRNGHGPALGEWTPAQPALAPHPLADLFPRMVGQDLEGLTADIQAYGVREPIWLYEGKILDGVNRFTICQALGLPCPTRTYTGDDPLGFVVSMNLQRRHLSESQRAMIAAKLATMRQGARTDVQPRVNLPEVSNAKAAATLNISESLVKHAKKVQAEAQPEVIRAVEAGQLAVSAAAKLAEEPVPIQRAVVQHLTRGTATTVAAALKQVWGDPELNPARTLGPSADEPFPRPPLRTRQSVLLDPATIAPVGSVPWAEACRQQLLQDVDRALGGRAEFGRDLLGFSRGQGWQVLTDAAGVPFPTFEAFALAPRPHGLQLTPDAYRWLMDALHPSTRQEVGLAAPAEEPADGA